jgi:hypothetical protein
VSGGRSRLRVLRGGAQAREARVALWDGAQAGQAPVVPRGGAQAGQAPVVPRGGAQAGQAPVALRGGAQAAHAPGRLVAGALAAAGSFLLEPAVPQPEPPSWAPSGPRPLVAVFGLARGCGVTVVSRALAAELAGRDPGGVAAVHCDAGAAGIPLATRAATRLARALADVAGADTRAVGSLCLVAGAERAALADTARHHAPLVVDAGSASLGGAPAALADRVIVVATASTEPALAAVAAECLERVGHEPIVVLNRTPVHYATDGGRTTWSTRQVHRLPESRMGARFALGGREARGELGRAVAELADLCEAR